MAGETNARLAVEYRRAPALLELDCERRHHHDRQRHHDRQQAREQIEQPRGQQPQRVAAETLTEDHPARIQRVDAHLSRLAFEKSEQLSDLDAGDAALEQFPERETPPPILHGHDNLMHLVPVAQREQVGLRSEHPLGGNAYVLATGLQEAHDFKAASIGTAPQPRHRSRALSNAINEHAAFEESLVRDPREQDSRDQCRAEREQRGEPEDAAADPQGGNDVERGGGDDSRRRGRRNEAHRQARYTCALARAVKTESQQADYDGTAEGRRAGPQHVPGAFGSGRIPGPEAEPVRQV